MFEHGIRGDNTQAVRRYAKMRNKYTGEGESSFLRCLDTNNLYGAFE